jgi:hypothetical protein
MRHLGFAKSKWFLFASGAVLGALIILGVRFVTYKPDVVHYHANFAVYINGQREEFKGPQYYQEVAACTVHGTIQPAQRAHMHDNINSVIHVHDHAVTWGQFFENLGWYIGPNFLETDDDTMYLTSDTNKLHIVLNNQDLTDLSPITNMVIRDQDRMLISYGNIDAATVKTEYKSVPATAHHYDVTPDPMSCSGQMEKTTISDRLHHLF